MLRTGLMVRAVRAVEAPSSSVPQSVQGLASILDVVAPIAGTGIVGAFLLMILFRVKIMPTWVYDEAKAAWDKADVARQAAWDKVEAAKDADIADLKAALREANNVYTQQVIPTLTRVLDSERELVDLRRDEQAERRQRRNKAEED